MTAAIMQPYLFPYIGYWQLINAVDVFVIYDNIEFSKGGWINKNNILLNGEKKLFSLPVKKDKSDLNIIDRYIADDSQKHIKKILAQIKNSYLKAPYFNDVYPVIENIFLNKEKNLFKYILYSIKEICNYLKINTNIVISSSIDIDHDLKSQDKVIAINKELNAKRYINPIGGIDLYDKDMFKKNDLELLYLESDIPKYEQFNDHFIRSLSIIDIIMFNSVDEVREMFTQYKLI